MAEEKPKPPEEVQKPPEEVQKPPEEVQKPPEEPPKAPEVTPKPPERTQKAEENVVFIGKKPVMNYVIACLTYFNTGGKKVCIKARGRAISRAVDTVELLKRSFVKDLKLVDIKLGTEELTEEQGRRSNVSTIEITITKA